MYVVAERELGDHLDSYVSIAYSTRLEARLTALTRRRRARKPRPRIALPNISKAGGMGTAAKLILPVNVVAAPVAAAV